MKMMYLPIVKFTGQVIAQVVLDKVVTKALDKTIKVYKNKKSLRDNGKVEVVDE